MILKQENNNKRKSEWLPDVRGMNGFIGMRWGRFHGYKSQLQTRRRQDHLGNRHWQKRQWGIVIQLVTEWRTEGGCRRRMSHLGWQCHLGLGLGRRKLVPAASKPAESPCCGPRISAHAFPTWWRVRFLFRKIDFYLIKKNDSESPLIFVLFLKGKQNKKEKTLSVTPYFGKGGLWKTGSGSGVRLLIEKVR